MEGFLLVTLIACLSSFAFLAIRTKKTVKSIGTLNELAQKRTVESLIEYDLELRTLVNEAPLCIYFFDPATKRIIYANPAFVELLAYPLEELKTKTIYELVDYPKEEVDERFERLMLEKKIPNDERRFKRKDGELVQVLVSSFFKHINNRDIIYVAAQDITSRKRKEAEMMATNKELETFIYKASHDLRGPLASIIGLVNLSKTEIKDETAGGYLDLINTSVNKLDYTLKELVKAMDIKNVQKFKDTILFPELIADVLEKFSYVKGYSRLQTTVDISFQGSFVANKPIIETILQNLIENAIKYQNYKTEHPFLKIMVNGDAAGVVITVEDNGTGIDPAIQHRIFDMYFRGTEASQGSGLGLYLVKKGIEKLQGEMQLESAPGIGSRFTILLKHAA
jgi:PAS domain S-box-containing protein